MSFFIKGKSGKPQKRIYTTNKYQPKGKTRKKAKQEVPTSDKADKVSSEEEENCDYHFVDSFPEDVETETPQEKKLRLAKLYLEEIEKEEQKRREHEDELSESENGNFISKRLKSDYLKESGKLQLAVADQYIGADIPNIKILKCKDHHSTITCIYLSSNNFIFSGTKDGSIVKWALQDFKRVASLPYVKKTIGSSKEILGHSKPIMCITVSSDNKFLVVGDTSNDIQIWNADDLKHIGTLKGHRGAITGVVIRQNTHTLYSCSKDRSIKVWSLDEMSYIETMYGHQDGVTAIDALSRDRAITSGGRDCTIRIWKIVEESQLIYSGHSGSIDVIRLINEENFISGGDDGQICIWSSMKKKPLCSIKEAHGLDIVTSQPLWITSVTSLLNTNIVASGSYNGLIKIWKLGGNFRSIELLFIVEITGFINALSFSQDGKYLVAGVGREHRFGRWNIIKEANNSIVIIPLLKR